MLNFVPNIVILDYLKVTAAYVHLWVAGTVIVRFLTTCLFPQNSRQLSPAVENRARAYMEKGYQQELTYRHKDGSFSAFGETDPSGSTWSVYKL